MHIYELAKNIEILKSRQRCCIINIIHVVFVAKPTFAKMSVIYTQISVLADRPDLEQNGSRVFRANFAKFIASSCFRTVDPRYVRSFVLSRSKSCILKLCKSFFSMLHLRFLDDSISEASTVKLHQSQERGSNVDLLSVSIFIRKQDLLSVS